MTAAIGYIGALVAIIGWGISKAPMKMPRVRNSGTDMFVFQLYNSGTVFVVSWLALAFVDFNYTPWGILGGAFWVPGSVLANYAINYLGLAVAQGTWAGTTMIVSFLWGVIFFGQKPKSPGLTFLAFVMIIIGIVGVTFARKKYYYLKVVKKQKAPRKTTKSEVVISIQTSESQQSLTALSASTNSLTSSTTALTSNLSTSSSGSNLSSMETPESSDVESDKSGKSSSEEEEKKKAEANLEVLTQKYGREQALKYIEAQAPPPTRPRGYTISLEQIAAGIEKRKKKILGFALAVMMGVLNASIFIPTELIDDDKKGITYVVSYGIGIGVVTPFYGLIWFGLYKREWPQFNARAVAWPAFISGALVAIGNAGSTLATKYLGYGIGYPLTQLSLLVAGVYGMIIYNELQGLRPRLQYLLAALVLLCGALILALFGRE